VLQIGGVVNERDSHAKSLTDSMTLNRGKGKEHKKHKRHKKEGAFLAPLVLLVFLSFS
jgi:hypothetical protein